ncbi:MAG: tetratricopeptide repeat protein [Chloroflexota bacterium]|nr:tetratricopeptide repeat protein [Chloroflexota bacterium]
MAVFPSEDRLRMKRQRSEKAIQLAMQNRWQEAAELNRQILESFPEDVDTLNRLGKAQLELGQYADALEQYTRASKLDASNSIAQKNIARLTKLIEEGAGATAAIPPPSAIDPSLFIEESGKTAVTELVDRASFDQIAGLTAGDKMELKVAGGIVQVVSPTGVVIGLLEPRIAQRVIRLVEMGNRYSAAITSIDESHIRIILREEYKDPSMGTRPSFPTQAADVRAYTREGVFRVDNDEDDDELSDDTEPDLEATEIVAEDLDTPVAADADDTDISDDR